MLWCAGRSSDYRGASSGVEVVAMAAQFFEMVGEITEIRTIAVGRRIHRLDALVSRYGEGRWLKRKGTAIVRLSDGSVCLAELHWYEAHGIGRKHVKLKRFL